MNVQVNLIDMINFFEDELENEEIEQDEELEI